MGLFNRIKGVLPQHPDARRETRTDFIVNRGDVITRHLSQEGGTSVQGNSLFNNFLGYGTGRDKLAYSSFSALDALHDPELDALYYSDDVGSRIVNLLPSEMLRAGYTLVAKDQEAARALQEKGKKVGLDEAFLRAMQWGRLRGGAAILIGAIDGATDLSQPLNVKKVREVRYLNVLDRRRISALRWQEDPLLPRYNQPESYTVGTNTSSQTVHASRLITFCGVPETDPIMRRALNGWTHSALQRPYDVLRKFAMAYESASQLIADASQGVWKIENLLDAIANNKDELMARMQLADMTRSAGRAIMVDAQTEDFTRVATPMGGVGDILDRLQQRLAAAAEMPVTVLMGRSPAGQNATGDSDFRSLYGNVKSKQVNELKPQLLVAYNILAAGNAPEGLDIEFNPLWEQTAEEEARTNNLNAQSDKIYSVDIGAIGPEQIALARFGSGKGKIEVNEDKLRASIVAEETFSASLEEARDTLSNKNLAALSVAKGMAPMIVNAMLTQPDPSAEPEAGTPTDEEDGSTEEKADPDAAKE